MSKKKKSLLHKAITRVRALAKRRAELFRFDVTTSFPVNRTLWVLNVLLFAFYVSLFIGPSFLRSSVLDYSDVKSDPYDGTVMPISFVPNWLNVKNTYKTLRYEEIPVSEFVTIPRYDTTILADDTQKNKDAIMARYTYITPYMGSYRGNYTEFDGSHLAVDIRAPLGTPILSIANGVVTKVKDTESGDGKYVIIRHDNVRLNGSTETIYSAYEHVNEIVAVEGTKVKRGDVIAHVGMTGITTTPHLHLQIDRASAPYHPYWPYTFKDASTLGLDFFSAVNVGLGKENAIAYTIHPLEFIQGDLKPLSFWETKEIELAGSTSSAEDPKTPSTLPTLPSDDLNSAPEEPSPTKPVLPSDTTPEITTEPVAPATPEAPVIWNTSKMKDIAPDSKYYAAVQSLVEKGVIKGYADGTFHPERPISRREAIIIVFRLFDVAPDTSISASIFRDIKKDDIVKPYLDYALDRGIISPNKFYRPDDTVSRAELVKLLIQTAGIKPEATEARFADIPAEHGFFPYVTTFAQIMGVKGGDFEPNTTMDRGSVANVLYAFAQKVGK